MFEFNLVMNNGFLDERKKSEEILNLYKIKKEIFNNLVEFFDYFLKGNFHLEICLILNNFTMEQLLG